MTVALSPPYTQNTVLLKTRGPKEEWNAGASSVITPGSLVEFGSAGTILPHAVAGGKAEKRFAIEDALQGHWFLDQSTGLTFYFTSGDPVQTIVAQPGDHILAVVAAGAPAIAKGDSLMSAGDGTLVKPTTVGNHTLYSSTAASAAVTNTITPTTFSTGSYTIPANTLVVGDVITIRGQGIATATHSTDTLSIILQIGAGPTTVLTLPALDVANGDTFEFEINIEIRTIGASGTFVAEGFYIFGVPGTATSKGAFLGSTAINTTLSQLIAVTATWSVADVGNSVRLDVLDVERSMVTPYDKLAKALVSLDNSSGSYIAYLPVQIL